MIWRSSLAIGVALVASCAVARLPDGGALPDADTSDAAFDHMRGPANHAHLSMLDDNASAWAARWALLASAKQSIDATYFIVENDAFGRAFLGHLYFKAAAGVDVRLLIDGRGSLGLALPFFGRDDLQELTESGHADVRVFNPPLRQLPRVLVERSPIPAATSTHNKILVVDGASAIIGGRNISRAYFLADDELDTSVSDADATVVGTDAVHAIDAAMTREFSSFSSVLVHPDIVNIDSQKATLLASYAAMDAWLHARVPAEPYDDAVASLAAVADAFVEDHVSKQSRVRIDDTIDEIVRAQSLYGRLAGAAERRFLDADVRVVESASRALRSDHSANDAMLLAIDAAQREIIIETPTFILTPQQLAALSLAARRGVAITVLTNSPLSSDNPSAQALFIDSWPELEARIPGLRVFVGATRHMLHGKRAVVDDLAFIGSYNFDPFSAHLNSELVVVAHGPGVVREIRGALLAEESEGSMLEYRILRAPDGNAVRFPPDSARAGRVVVTYGPANHVAKATLDDLERLKVVLMSIRSMWDFTVVAW